MAKDENYNWWTDPKNKEEVDKLSWWDHAENRYIIYLPISIVKDGDMYVASFNTETKKYFGEDIHGCAMGKSTEEAVEEMFYMIRFEHEYLKDKVLNYQRFIPFRKGDWKHVGGTWFVIFGMHVYFRHGKGMKGGWYIPFTKLNVSITNEWANYRKHKNKLKNTLS
jgi:hypothetical protein